MYIYQGRFKVGSLQGSFRFVSFQGPFQVPIPPLFFPYHRDDMPSADAARIGGEG